MRSTTRPHVCPSVRLFISRPFVRSSAGCFAGSFVYLSVCSLIFWVLSLIRVHSFVRLSTRLSFGRLVARLSLRPVVRRFIYLDPSSVRPPVVRPSVRPFFTRFAVRMSGLKRSSVRSSILPALPTDRLFGSCIRPFVRSFVPSVVH